MHMISFGFFLQLRASCNYLEVHALESVDLLLICHGAKNLVLRVA